MSHIEWLEIDYPALVREPAPAVSRLIEFLGAERLPNEAAMAAAIDPTLHRRKGS
jgi:LPS sulfotransferase NodH